MNRITTKITCNLPDAVLEELGIADIPKESVELKKAYCKLCPEICEEATEGCEGCPITEAFNKLYQYEDEEEKGLYLRIPCKIGDHVYTIFPGSIRVPKMLLKCTISKIEITNLGITFSARANLCEESFVICTDYKFGVLDLGDKFFLKESEALNAFSDILGGRKNENFTR